MNRGDFEVLIRGLGENWRSGDARAAADRFAEAVDYADPRRYRYSSRAELEPFFDAGVDGHTLEWHRILFDETAQAGVVEYTYVGHHRYHGAAIVEVDAGGRISRWREWQHLDDERDWDAYLAGEPREDRESP